MLRVFLSYRRQNASDEASRIHRWLAARPESEIFLDTIDIPPAGDIWRIIHDRIEACEILVLVLHQGWEAEFRAAGDQDPEWPGDWVRHEVEIALSQWLPILPVLLNGAQMARAEDLPPRLKKLRHLGPVKVGQSGDFDGDMATLSAILKAAVAAHRPARRAHAALEESWRQGAWEAAYRDLLEALLDPVIRTTRLHGLLLNLEERARWRAKAQEAFRDDRFLQALDALEAAADGSWEIAAATRVAGIGVRIAQACTSGQWGELAPLEREYLDFAQRAGRQHHELPGVAEVGAFLEDKKRTRDSVWRALRRDDLEDHYQQLIQQLIRDTAEEAYHVYKFVWVRPAFKTSLWLRVRHSGEEVIDQWLSTWIRTFSSAQPLEPNNRLIEVTATSFPPPARLDRAAFTVTAPAFVVPRSRFFLGVWVHREGRLEAAVQRARRRVGEGDAAVRNSQSPERLAGGRELAVHLELEGMVVPQGWQPLPWDGDIGAATFLVQVPAGAAHGHRWGQAAVYLDGLRIASLLFVLQVGPAVAAISVLRTHEKRYLSAFACHASEDRAKVLARIQGIRAAAPRLELVFDLFALRSGDHWALWQTLSRNDIFYLFWSPAASRCRRVDREWRSALRLRGLDFIDPVPLASRDEAPPPLELAAKSVEWILGYQPGGSAGPM